MDGVGGMLTFLELAHMLDATQWMGWIRQQMHMYIRAWQWRWENTALPNFAKNGSGARKTPEKSVAPKWQDKVLRNAGFKQKPPKSHSSSKPFNNMLASHSIAFTVEILPRIVPHWK